MELRKRIIQMENRRRMRTATRTVQLIYNLVAIITLYPLVGQIIKSNQTITRFPGKLRSLAWGFLSKEDEEK